ncbi:PAS domain-containing hybrid sensor histidine kinase/response regulator [Sphingomonas sp. PAMC 26617]|uniref:PAS domain-containing hybrid sensor histidine kinase/response regulator n=1 Tax=Sphingomonas sp. PAMC 26617 TaxID=1112216 RepID=UPI000303E481|nr:PAS domain-containing hybrid sensor histidine kinase/response regulator [Sphingomonas sp. PAMC 26617]
MDSGVVRLDLRSREIFGFSAVEDLTDQAVFGRIHEEDLPSVYAESMAAVSAGKPLNVHYRIVLPDGVIRQVDSLSEPVLSPKGRTVLMSGVFVDITDQKNAEVALRESEARFRTMADRAPVMMWVTDPDGFCTHLNARWYEFTGQAPGAGEGYGWLDAVHPEDRPSAERAFVSANTEQRDYRIEFRLRAADGVYRWTIDTAAARFDEAGQYLGYVGSIIDINDRREHESKLTLKEEQLRLAIDIGEIGEWDVDQLTGSMFWPPRVKAMFGISADVPVTLDDYYNGVHPDDQEATRKAYEAASNPNLRAFYDVEYRTVGKEDGIIRWVAAKGRGLFNADGDCTRVIGTAIDITERKRIEEQLRELNETLETRVAERTAELQQAEDALRQSQKMEAMGSLTGGVAHDFNNLLTPIVGALDLLQRKGVGGEREQRLIAGAIQSADRARTLVQRLLAFARRQPLQPVAVDIAGLVKGMAELLASTTGPRVHVVVDVADDLPPANADRNQLEMALLNLGVNARDAMPDGGTLRISATRDSVRAPRSTLKRGHYVRLSVADTGLGMDDATLARAVEPFFSTKGIGKGTGLGLSMAHGLAAQLGGSLTIQSRQGVGTNIELWLPISAVVPDGRTYGQSPAALGRASGVVLLVDDEEVVRASTADMLEELGYEVRQAVSGEEAMERVAEGLAPDLLITDHLMPGMTGVELAHALRETKPNLPVLIVSGYAETEGIVPDLPRLTKPFRSAELEESLATLTGSR